MAGDCTIYAWLRCDLCSCLSLGAVLLEPSEVSAFLSVLLWLDICPMLSLMESGRPERKQSLEGTPGTQGGILLKYPAQLSRCRERSLRGRCSQ